MCCRAAAALLGVSGMRLDGIHYSFLAGRTGRTAPFGHAHFWERAVSRRGLMQGAAVGVGALAGARLLGPGAPRAVAAASAGPRPIPGGILVGGQGFHVYPAGHSNPLDPSSPINEPSSITDFDGVVAITQTQGQGIERNRGVEAPLTFDADMRFMAGRYLGEDGQLHEGAFGFV